MPRLYPSDSTLYANGDQIALMLQPDSVLLSGRMIIRSTGLSIDTQVTESFSEAGGYVVRHPGRAICKASLEILIPDPTVTRSHDGHAVQEEITKIMSCFDRMSNEDLMKQIYKNMEARNA